MQRAAEGERTHLTNVTSSWCDLVSYSVRSRASCSLAASISARHFSGGCSCRSRHIRRRGHHRSRSRHINARGGHYCHVVSSQVAPRMGDKHMLHTRTHAAQPSSVRRMG
jgi:hypothetical protein